MLCASGTCSAPTGAGAEKRWQNNNLCELGNRSGTGRKESAFNRRGPTRKPDNQLGFEMFADDCNCTGHLGVDAFCLALHGADLHIRSGAWSAQHGNCSAWRSMYFMRWNRSAITGFRRMERIPRSHRMKFCVQRGLGALPSTSKRRGKSRRDFLLCGPVCINTGIACLFSPKMKRTSERIVKFHSLAQFVSNFSDNSVSSFTVSWV